MMVLEQIIPELFPQSCHYCTAIVDPNEPIQPVFAPFTSATPSLPAQPNGSTTRRSSSEEDDNYDDDFEPNSSIAGAGPNGQAAMNGAGSHAVETVETNGSPVPALTIETDDFDVNLIPIDDMYYSLEYDAEAVEEYNKVQENMLMEDYDSPGPETPTDTLPVKFEFRLAHGPEYLFKALKKDVPTDKVDGLRDLLAKVRPSRSKWYCAERVGQEELYISLEMVLNELKSCGENAQPFLEPVSEQIAPNYRDSIKYPMDLGTVGKKLQNQEYDSKGAFAADLNLIWSNCMEFNRESKFYKDKAKVMRRRTTELLKKVPEITIVVRHNDDSDDEGMIKPDPAPRINIGNEREDSQQLEDGIKMEVDEVNGGSEGFGFPGPAALDVDDFSEGGRRASIGLQNGMRESVGVDEFVDVPGGGGSASGADEVVDEGSVQFRRWKEVTLKLRHDVGKFREEQASLRFSDRKALLRRVGEMEAYVDYETEAVHRNKRRKTLMSSGLLQEPFLDDRDQLFREGESLRSVAFLPESMYPVASVPSMVVRGQENEGDVADRFLVSRLRALRDSQPSLSDYPALQTTKMGRVAKAVHNNVREHKRIRELHAKILAYEVRFEADVHFSRQSAAPNRDTTPFVLQQNETGPTPPDPLTVPPPKPEMQPYKPVRDEVSLPPLVLNAESAGSALKQIATMHLADAGFEAGNESAIAALTDTVGQYFMNLGKTMRVYLDKFGKTFSPEDILLHTLKENGVESPQQLDQFVTHDVKRHGAKLFDLRRKLDYAYKDLVREAADGDFQEEEASEQIMSGNFFEDLGVDFLNLKDLGLDITSVPTELWNRKSDKPIRARVRRRFIAQEEEEVAPVQPLERTGTLLPWRPIDPALQIGLLKAFYQKKVEEDDMVETEDKDRTKVQVKSKQLLRIAMQGRKRGPPGAGGDDAAKKKKKGPDPALKAQKEAEKQKKLQEKEAKAKAMQEKKEAKANKQNKKKGGGAAE
ncbi:Transcriptional activator spt7 [Rhizophlyctis rosea]|uniref:Transcriptional activator spt7 n=1 Tax=Rhizophlyctis rosea TaxID=64517 RepID=A0AAD5X4X7_9FUNG|nr:Transcriptional activator spt7 [Rhizophlyctis rosea]